MENTLICYNQQQFVELNYDFIIEEPSFLTQGSKESFCSPVFCDKANGKINWRLKIFPRGVNVDADYHFSLYLERVMDNKDPPVIVQLKVTIWKNGEEIFSHSGEPEALGCDPLPSCVGWDKIGKRPFLFDDPSEPIFEELKISCQLIYIA